MLVEAEPIEASGRLVQGLRGEHAPGYLVLIDGAFGLTEDFMVEGGGFEAGGAEHSPVGDDGLLDERLFGGGPEAAVGQSRTLTSAGSEIMVLRLKAMVDARISLRSGSALRVQAARSLHGTHIGLLEQKGTGPDFAQTAKCRPVPFLGLPGELVAALRGVVFDRKGRLPI